ncbi:MAG TPA: DUF222 domain-containing protein [Streptosporangiaceae bacterium]|nr:DUF222 domain-containing protein [Streptosporangiaceae bacterium]
MDGDDAWLTDLRAPTREECLSHGWEPSGPDVIKAGFGFREPGNAWGFGSGGVADSMPPGPVLATLTGDTCQPGLSKVSDDELIGALRAARRLTSWAQAMELAAAGELTQRRFAEQDAGEAGVGDHVVDEVAAALTLTGRAADRLVNLAVDLSGLPATAAALAAGDIDLPRAGVVEETGALSAGHRAPWWSRRCWAARVVRPPRSCAAAPVARCCALTQAR